MIRRFYIEWILMKFILSLLTLFFLPTYLFCAQPPTTDLLPEAAQPGMAWLRFLVKPERSFEPSDWGKYVKDLYTNPLRCTQTPHFYLTLINGDNIFLRHLLNQSPTYKGILTPSREAESYELPEQLAAQCFAYCKWMNAGMKQTFPNAFNQ